MKLCREYQFCLITFLFLQETVDDCGLFSGMCQTISRTVEENKKFGVTLLEEFSCLTVQIKMFFSGRSGLIVIACHNLD